MESEDNEYLEEELINNYWQKDEFLTDVERLMESEDNEYLEEELINNYWQMPLPKLSSNLLLPIIKRF